jgi:hypothetical protein
MQNVNDSDNLQETVIINSKIIRNNLDMMNKLMSMIEYSNHIAEKNNTYIEFLKSRIKDIKEETPNTRENSNTVSIENTKVRILKSDLEEKPKVE